MPLHEDDEDCLNLDRDAHNVPLLYGFNCSAKQAFVCQIEGKYKKYIQCLLMRSSDSSNFVLEH